jgi:hypothetical protein
MASNALIRSPDRSASNVWVNQNFDRVSNLRNARRLTRFNYKGNFTFRAVFDILCLEKVCRVEVGIDAVVVLERILQS